MKICCEPGCTNECMPHRKRCHQHFRERSNLLDKIRRANGYKEPLKPFTCECCGKTGESRSDDRRFCDDCLQKLQQSLSSSNYISLKRNGKNIEEHRKIARDLGVLTAGRHDVVHHLNGNKQDNDRHNLVVLSLKDHGKLHAYIKEQLLKGSTKSIEVMSWEFINNNAIPHFHCSDNPEDF